MNWFPTGFRSWKSLGKLESRHNLEEGLGGSFEVMEEVLKQKSLEGRMLKLEFLVPDMINLG